MPGERSFLRLVSDGLSNAVSGLGGPRDKRAYDHYAYLRALSQIEVESAYRGSWLGRKIHDLPPFDMTRAWRDWQADKATIGKLEAEERRHNLRAKTRAALTWARLYGGSAIILGLPGDTAMPANLTSAGPGTLSYVHVVSRWQVTYPDIDRDLSSEFFGQPTYYELAGQSGVRARIHPSRVVPFIGQPAPDGALGLGGMGQANGFWGDPLLQSVIDSIKNADLSQGAVAGLLHELKIDTLKIKDLASNLAAAGGEKRLQDRIAAANFVKSMLNTRVIDAEDDWATWQTNLAGMSDLMQRFVEFVAGATDIPVTRLMGTSAKGLNATGEGDNDNYDEMISARQETDLRPCLDRIDAALIRSAGVDPEKVFYSFAPLVTPDPSEEADLQAKKAATAALYVTSGLVPRKAMALGVQNALVEDSCYPGIEDALKALTAKVGMSVEELKALAPVWTAGAMPKKVIFQLLLEAGMLPDDITTYEDYATAIEEEGPALGTMTDPAGNPVDPNAPPVPQPAPDPLRRAANDARAEIIDLLPKLLDVLERRQPAA